MKKEERVLVFPIFGNYLYSLHVVIVQEKIEFRKKSVEKYGDWCVLKDVAALDYMSDEEMTKHCHRNIDEEGLTNGILSYIFDNLSFTGLPHSTNSYF